MFVPPRSADATSRCGNARRCCTTSCWGLSTEPSRSQGLSVLSSIATAHSSTARILHRTFRAKAAFTCQIGVRISSTSALVTSETAISPMRGKAYRSRLDIQSWACFGLRQPVRFCSTTFAAASAKLGMPRARRFSASGSPPSRANLRFARAFSRASASETSATLPSPKSRRRPRMTRR